MQLRSRLPSILYPLWQIAYLEAINETDSAKLTEKISAAGLALFKRGQQIAAEDIQERNAMAEATVQLRKLIATKLLKK